MDQCLVGRGDSDEPLAERLEAERVSPGRRFRGIYSPEIQFMRRVTASKRTGLRRPGTITASQAETSNSSAAQDGQTATEPPAPVPDSRDLEVLRGAVKSCRACPLYARATCAVFGEGPRAARVMLIGEQPGAAEDRAGRPFVGPAGRMLDRALKAAGLDREECYVTNAVKHFKWVQKGKLHMHATPNAAEVAACRPWLEAEARAIAPRLVICLGATAAGTVMGRPTKILANRGRILNGGLAPALITVHPSMLLRMPSGHRDAAFEAFVNDLRVARRHLS